MHAALGGAVTGRSDEAVGRSGDVLRHARRRVGPPRRARTPSWRPVRAARRWRWPSPPAPSWACTSSTTSGRPRSSLSVSGSTDARRAAVHEWHGGGQLPPRGRRSRPVRRADARRHRRSPSGAPRRRRAADHRPDRPVRRLGALVPRPGRRRPAAERAAGARSPGRALAATATRPGPPQPAVPRAVPRRGRRAAAAPTRRADVDAGTTDRRRSPMRRSLVDAAARTRRDPRRRAQRRRADDVGDALRTATGWPVLADPPSGVPSTSPAPSRAFDAMLRVAEFADAHRPDVVVRIGRPAGVEGAGHVGRRERRAVVQIGGPGVDRSRSPRRVDAPGLGDRLAGRARCCHRPATAWLARRGSSARRRPPRRSIDGCWPPQPALTEPAVARTVADDLPRRCPARGRLVDAGARPGVVRRPGGARPRQPRRQRHRRRRCRRPSASPSAARPPSRSSATSPSSTTPARSPPWPAGRRPAHRRRRQRRRRHLLVPAAGDRARPRSRFEQLFGTPHGTDLVALAAAHGLDATTVDDRGRTGRPARRAGPIGHASRHRPRRERRRPRRRSTPPSPDAIRGG